MPQKTVSERTCLGTCLLDHPMRVMQPSRGLRPLHSADVMPLTDIFKYNKRCIEEYEAFYLVTHWISKSFCRTSVYFGNSQIPFTTMPDPLGSEAGITLTPSLYQARSKSQCSRVVSSLSSLCAFTRRFRFTNSHPAPSSYQNFYSPNSL